MKLLIKPIYRKGIKKAILLLIFFLSANSFALVYEDVPKDVSFKFISRVDLIVNNNRAIGKVFYSKSPVKEIIKFYREEFTKEGYVEVSGNIKEGALAVLSFKKGVIKNNVQVLPGKNGSVIIRYEVEEKEQPLKGKDKPGKDLAEVPRPVGSVRELCMERISGAEKSTTLVYKTSQPQSSLEIFYKDKMKTGNWQHISTGKEEGVTMIFSKNNSWCVINCLKDSVVISYYYRG